MEIQTCLFDTPPSPPGRYHVGIGVDIYIDISISSCLASEILGRLCLRAMSRPHTPAFNIRRPPINTSSLSLTSSVNNNASSSNLAISRSVTPLSRNVISLEDWESKAPLSDAQLQSIALVRERLGERPLPEKVKSTTSRMILAYIYEDLTHLPSLLKPNHLYKHRLDHPHPWLLGHVSLPMSSILLQHPVPVHLQRQVRLLLPCSSL